MRFGCGGKTKLSKSPTSTARSIASLREDASSGLLPAALSRRADGIGRPV
jgi:hypothetical protein